MTPLLETTGVPAPAPPPASVPLSALLPGLPPTPVPDPVTPGLVSLRQSLLYDLAFLDPLPAIRSAADGSLALDLATSARLPAGFAQLTTLLGLPDALKVQGSITVSLGSATFDLTLTPATAAPTPPTITVGPVTVRDVTLHLRSRLAADGTALTVLECDGTVDVGKTQPVSVPVSAVYSGGDATFHFSATLAPGTLTLARGIGAVGEWIGGAAGDLSLPDSLAVPASFYLASVDLVLDTGGAGAVKHLALAAGWDAPWSIADGLTLAGVQVAWSADSPFDANRTADASVTGTLVLGAAGKAHFDVTATRSAGFTISGKLRPGEPFDLGDLVADALGFPTAVPTLQVDALAVTATSGGDFSVAGVVTTPWAIDVEHQTLALERLAFSVQRKGAAKSAQLAAQADVAGTRFAIQATLTEQDGGQGGIVFQGGTLDAAQSIKLTRVVGSLLSYFNTTLPSNAPDVDVQDLVVRFDTATKEFHFEARTNGTIQVPFISGDGANIHAAVSLTSTTSAATGKRSLAGFMEGDLQIGSSTFTLQYSLGQDSHLFVAAWEGDTGTLALGDVLGAMGIPSVTGIPDGVELGLKSAYLEYQSETKTLSLVATSSAGGDAFLVANQPTGSWQFLFGLEYQGHTGLSSIPVLGSGLGDVDRVFTFERVGIMLASGDFKKLKIPALPPLQALTKGTAPGAGAKPPAPPAPIGGGKAITLKEGLSLVGVIDFDRASGDGAVGALRKVVPQSELTITATYGEAAGNLTLNGVLDGSVSIPTGGSSDLTLGDASLALVFAPDAVDFRVSGDLTFGLAGRTFDVQPALTIGEEEVFFSVDVTIDGGWSSPMGIRGLVLDDIDFSMGVAFEPPGLLLGLEGKSHFTGRPPNSDDFAFVLEMVEEVPDPLLLSFYVDQIDLPTALTVYTGVDVSSLGLPSFMSEIAFTDVSFYWCESVVTLPDGSIAQPGLRFSGNVEILGLGAHAALAIDEVSGIAGELLLAPIHLGGVLDVTGKGAGVYRMLGADGKVSHTQVAPKAGAPPATRTQVVAPGGAVFQFQTKRSPYLVASVDVTLFDFVGEEIDALVADDGMHLKVVYWISSVVKAELDVTLNKERFAASSQFSLNLKADLGPIEVMGVDFGTIHLDTGFDLDLSISASADDFSISIDGDFDFEGARLSIPTLTLSVAPSSLKQLPEWLLKHVEDNLEEIFGDLFSDVKQRLEDAAKEVAAVAVEAADAVEKVGEQAVNDAAQVAAATAQGIENATEAVAQETVAVEQETAQIATAAAAEVEQVGQAAAQEVEQIGGQIAQVAEEAAHEVEAIGSEIAQEAEQVGQQVEQIATAAVQEVEQIGQAVEDEAKQILGDAEQVADSVVSTAKVVASDIEQAAEAVWSDVKVVAEKAEQALEDAANAVAHAAESAWHEISKY